MVWPAAVLVLVFAVWTPSLSDAGFVRGVLPPVLAVLAVVAAGVALLRRREGWSFTATAATIGLTVVSIFSNLYPDVMVSSTGAADSLTVAGTASGEYALKVMTVVALVLVPVVLAYQGWTYVVFRRRVAGPPAHDTSAGPVPDPSSPADEGVPA